MTAKEDKPFKLLKNGHCHVPEDIGVKDVLTAFGKVYRIGENISPAGYGEDIEIIDCSQKIICPGLIDQHVHITGGGGEEGPESRIPELMLSEIVRAGVTTVVGVLGIDGVFRNIAELLAKAKALESEGINTYIYTGSYSVPTATLTGNVVTDVAFIDKVIGVGEIAIADFRSSYPTLDQLKKLAAETRTGSLLGKKAGVMHIHVGDGKDGLTPLFELADSSDFPREMFVPTHVNRNKKLFMQATEYLRKGGNIDLTAGESSENGCSVPDALKLLNDQGADMQRVTVSSDGNGSIPFPDGTFGVGRVLQLFEDIRQSILGRSLDFETALNTVTANVARILKIFPQRGAIREGSCADILILNENDLNLTASMAGGKFLFRDGQVIVKGRYEK